MTDVQIIELIRQVMTTIGGLGSFAILIFLWKAGFFGKKNGNGKEVIDLLKKLEGNDLTHIAEDLREIKNAMFRMEQRLNEVSENIIYIKARTNNKS